MLEHHLLSALSLNHTKVLHWTIPLPVCYSEDYCGESLSPNSERNKEKQFKTSSLGR